MTDVNEILEDVLHCLPGLQVNVNREVGKRYRELIEKRCDYWMPNDVTIGMLKSFKETVNCDRLTNYKNDYSGVDDEEDLSNWDRLEPKSVAMGIENSRGNSAGLPVRDLKAVALATSQNYENLVMGGIGPCDAYCAANCPNRTNPQAEHLCTLEGLVTAQEAMAFLARINAHHIEIDIDLSRFSTELAGRLLRDERIKAAKSLAIDLVHGLRSTNEWGNLLTAEDAANYFSSPGNEERVLFLEDFAMNDLFVLFVLRIVQGFLAASETNYFCRMLFVESEEQTQALCIEHLKSLGHIPLVIENTPASDSTSVFIFKNPLSGETLSLKLGSQIVGKSVNFIDTLWARFKRLPESHDVADLIYDS